MRTLPLRPCRWPAPWCQQSRFLASSTFQGSVCGASDQQGPSLVPPCDLHLRGCLPQEGPWLALRWPKDSAPLPCLVLWPCPLACGEHSGSCWDVEGWPVPAHTWWAVGVHVPTRPLHHHSPLPPVAGPACPWGPVTGMGTWPLQREAGSPGSCGLWSVVQVLVLDDALLLKKKKKNDLNRNLNGLLFLWEKLDIDQWQALPTRWTQGRWGPWSRTSPPCPPVSCPFPKWVNTDLPHG